MGSAGILKLKMQVQIDVDHFRPKAEAKRTEDLVDADGYAWLAFDWENFRLSAQNCKLLKTQMNQVTR